MQWSPNNVLLIFFYPFKNVKIVLTLQAVPKQAADSYP